MDLLYVLYYFSRKKAGVQDFLLIPVCVVVDGV